MIPRNAHTHGTIFTLVIILRTVLWPPAVVQAFPAPSFQGLGDLPGGGFGSAAFATSADGTV